MMLPWYGAEMQIRSMSRSEAEAIARWLAHNAPTLCPPSLAPVCVPVPREAGSQVRRREIAHAMAQSRLVPTHAQSKSP